MSWGDNIRRNINQLSSSRAVFLATTGTMVQAAERIFERGGLTDGGTIQYNEDYELWAYKPPAPRDVSHKGKPNKDGKSKKIKGGYYETYLTFKADMGRAQTPFDLTSSLRKDWLGGVAATPTEQSPLVCVITLTDVNAAKAEGLAAQKGVFLRFTDQEKSDHTKRLADIWNNILDQ